MPGTILFIGSILIIVFYEIEGEIKSGAKTIELRRIIAIRRARKSWPMLAFFLLTFGLAAFEWDMYLNGEIYKEGIRVDGFIRVAMLTLFVSYKVYTGICLVKSRPVKKYLSYFVYATTLFLLVLSVVTI